MSLKISVGSDHAGVKLKATILTWLVDNGVETIDFGTNSEDSVDYPDYAHAVITNLLDGDSDLSVLICGSGVGMCMTANKHNGVRAALCWKKEIAELARLHNDANVLCLPARYISTQEAIEIVNVFMETEFEGGRHEKRVNKINPSI